MTEETHYKATLNNAATKEMVLAFLISSAVWFEHSPLDDGRREVRVKQEDAELLKRFILLAQDEI